MSRLCPNGHEVNDNFRFCPKCGAELKDNGTRFCKKCGTERKGTEKFCSKCGNSFDQVPINIISDINRNKENKSKKGIIIASVVALITLFGGAVWFFIGNQQDKYSLEGLAKAAVNYDFIGDFHEGLAMVEKGEKFGFIDKMGNEVIPCIYDFMEGTDCSFNDGLAFVRQGDSTFFIDKGGKKPFEFKYDYAKHFSEGLAVVWKDGKCGYIDTEGNEVINLTDKFDDGSDFSEGMAAVSKEGKVGFIDKKGNMVIPLSYAADEGDDPLSGYKFSEGYSAVRKGEKYGYIDTKGTEVIPCKFDYAHSYSEGLAVVMKGEKFGYIDKSGKEIIPFVFGSAGSFSEGFAVVSKNGKNIVIDKSGKVILTLPYDGIDRFKFGLARISKYVDNNIVAGFIDTDGKEVIPCIYSCYNDFSEGLVAVSKDGINGYIDQFGKSTFDYLSQEDIAKIKEKQQKQETSEEIIADDAEMEYDSQSQEEQVTVDITPILNECQMEITAIQREIEYSTQVYVSLASQDIDQFKYVQIRSTYMDGVDKLVRKADVAFDNCANKLRAAGFSDAEAKINVEKKNFHSVIYELRTRATQQTDMSY